MHNNYEEQRDDLEIEMTDLGPDGTPNPMPFVRLPMHISPRLRHSLFLSLLTILSLIFIFVLVSTPLLHDRLLSIFPSQVSPAPTPTQQLADSSQPSSKIGRTSNGSISVKMVGSNKLLAVIPGPIPTTCPAGPPVNQTHQVGNFPLWITGLDGPNAEIHLQDTWVPDLSDWKGWTVPLQLALKFNFIDPVTLTVGNLDDGPTPSFVSNNGLSPTTSITLDYHRAANVSQQALNEHPGIWKTTLSIPTNGCYYFSLSWPRGGWQVTFAAGR